MATAACEARWIGSAGIRGGDPSGGRGAVAAQPNPHGLRTQKTTPPAKRPPVPDPQAAPGPPEHHLAPPDPGEYGALTMRSCAGAVGLPPHAAHH